MNKIVKRILLLTSLLVALLIAVVLISNLFCKAASFDERRLGYYQNEPENSIDVLFIGASEIYAGWAPALAYKEYGFTSYPYCISAAPVTLWKSMVQEALKKQKPELVVVDTFGTALDANDTDFGLDNPAPKYQFLNTIPFSADKVKMVEDLCGGMKPMDKISYLFPFVKHHDNYVDFKENFDSAREILEGKTSPIKGMRTLTETYKPGPELIETRGAAPQCINEPAEAELRKFLDYCKTENINVLFVHFPADVTDEGFYYTINARCNHAGEIAMSYGYDYLNLQDYTREIGLNSNEDFYQPSHLNVKGQRKTTDYFANHLKRKYLKKRVHNKVIKNEWEEAYSVYEKFYEYACKCINNSESEYLEDGPTTMNKIKGE